MNKETTGHHKATHKDSREGLATTKSFSPSGTLRLAISVAAAAGGGLLAASLVGVGPAALAGAAAYLAYRGLTGERKIEDAGITH